MRGWLTHPIVLQFFSLFILYFLFFLFIYFIFFFTCLQLEKKGYLLGEKILVFGSIKNNTRCGMKRTMVTLVQTVTLTVYDFKSKKTQRLSSAMHGPLSAGGVDQWAGEALEVKLK
jgi:hypothetical protein